MPAAQTNAGPGGRNSLAAALSESPHFATLHTLGVGTIAELIDTARSKSTLADHLEDLDFPRLVRLAEAACRAESIAERLQSLALSRIIGLVAVATASSPQVGRLKAIDLEHLLYFYEGAVRDAGFSRNLELFNFPALVAALETAFHSPEPVEKLRRLDAFRLLRLLRALLGAERLAANPESLDPRHVFADPRPDQAPRGTIFDRIKAQPHGIDFFLALRSLQAAFPRWPKLGASVALREDYARLRQEPDLAFASSTIRSFLPGEPDRPDVPSQVSVNFLGLFGPNGPLPLHLTDYALDRIREGDQTLARFADVFQHRVLTLFFRAWAVHRKTVDLDRTDDRRFANYIAAFIGLGMPALHDRDAAPDMAKLYFSGRLACPTKNPEGLAAILGEFFGIPCEIQNFVGHWIAIPEAETCRLGASPASGTLGTTAIIGSRLFQYQTKFRVRLGPMRFADLRRLLPCEDSWPRLKAWVWNYIGKELFWDAQYVLLADEVPQTQLGGGALLGWTTWIITRKPGRDAEDVVIDGDLN
jgi:type VI secretion system protein ImpH